MTESRYGLPLPGRPQYDSLCVYLFLLSRSLSDWPHGGGEGVLERSPE